MKLTFEADKCTISERASDNSYKVVFFTGEYQQMQMAQLLLMPKDKALKITVEYEERKS